MRRSNQGITTRYLLWNLTFSFISYQHQLWFLSNLHNRISFYETIKPRGNNPILTLNLTFSFISHQHQLRFFQTFITGFYFTRRSKQGVTTPILTLKSNIDVDELWRKMLDFRVSIGLFLHISSTSTPISFKPS